MNSDSERAWIVKASLVVTGCLLLFSIAAPAIGFPLTYEQVPRVAEIVTPVVLGYLGTATHFLFSKAKHKRPFAHAHPELVRLLVRGPIVLFGVAAGAAFLAFGLTNRMGAARGTGMTVDQLSAALAASLALLTVTTNIIVSYLFAVEDK